MKQIACGFALAAAAFATQAQSSVTVFGQADAAATIVDTGGPNGRTKQLMSGIGPGPRFGLRGAEDMGGGLFADFMLESGVAWDTGGIQQGSVMWGRQAYVGLSSKAAGWTVTAGRQYSPSLYTLVAGDALGQWYWGSTVGVGYGLYGAPGAAAGTGTHQYTARINNSINVTQQLGSFSLRGMVGAGDETNNGAGRFLSVGGTYAANGLVLSASGARFRQNAASIVTGASPAWQSEAVFGASYDLKFLKLFTGYYYLDLSEANRTPAPTTEAGLAVDPRFLKEKAYWLGGRVPIGMGTLIMQVMHTQFDYPVTDGKANTYAIAYDHSLSKRTGVYVSYGKVANDAASRVSLFATTLANFPASAGADPSALSLGVRHSF